jgi:membrane protein DedA with SNARE-associated domain
MLNIVSLLIGVLAIPWVLLAVLPLVGALNWFVIPWALLGLFFGALSSRTSGRNLNLIVLLVAVVRLGIGGGLF